MLWARGGGQSTRAACVGPAVPLSGAAWLERVFQNSLTGRQARRGPSRSHLRPLCSCLQPAQCDGSAAGSVHRADSCESSLARARGASPSSLPRSLSVPGWHRQGGAALCLPPPRRQPGKTFGDVPYSQQWPRARIGLGWKVLHGSKSCSTPQIASIIGVRGLSAVTPSVWTQVRWICFRVS